MLIYNFIKKLYKELFFVGRFAFAYLMFCSGSFLVTFIILWVPSIVQFTLLILTFLLLCAFLQQIHGELFILKKVVLQIIKNVFFGLLIRMIFFFTLAFTILLFGLVKSIIVYICFFLIFIVYKKHFCLRIIQEYYRLLVTAKFTLMQFVFVLTILCSILIRVLVGTFLFGDFLDSNVFLDFLFVIPSKSCYPFLSESNFFVDGGVLFSPLEQFKVLRADFSRFSSHLNSFIVHPSTQRLFYELCTVGRLDALTEQFRNPVNTPVVRLLNSPYSGRPSTKLETFRFFKGTSLYGNPTNAEYIASADEKTLSAGIYVRMHEAAMVLADAAGEENVSNFEVIPRKDEWDNWFLRKTNSLYSNNLVTVPNVFFWHYMHGLGRHFDLSRCINEFDGINHLIVSYDSGCVNPIADPVGNRVADVFITGNQEILVELKSINQSRHDALVFSKEDLSFISKNENLIDLHDRGLLTNNPSLFKYIQQCYTKTGFLKTAEIQKVLSVWNYDSDFQKLIDSLPPGQKFLFDVNSKKFQLEFKGPDNKVADFQVPFNSTTIPEMRFSIDELKYKIARRLEQQRKFLDVHKNLRKNV